MIFEKLKTKKIIIRFSSIVISHPSIHPTTHIFFIYSIKLRSNLLSVIYHLSKRACTSFKNNVSGTHFLFFGLEKKSNFKCSSRNNCYFIDERFRISCTYKYIGFMGFCNPKTHTHTHYKYFGIKIEKVNVFQFN